MVVASITHRLRRFGASAFSTVNHNVFVITQVPDAVDPRKTREELPRSDLLHDENLTIPRR